MRRLSAFAGILLISSLPASGYYHFIHYLKSGTAPEKFDLAALPSKTMSFMVAGGGPSVFAKNDSLNSVVAQIQQAASAWDGVSASDLRVRFGGFEADTPLQNTPGGDIVFEDLPPGVEGFGGPTSRADAVIGPDGQPFIPIVRSVVHLNRNLTAAPGPSFDQSFLLTTIHEMGHALGLQHTFTASAMSQDTIRATTVAHPIDNDDIAGISALYPAAGVRQTGSISGRVTAAGKGIHLASVVAMRAGRGAISAFTDRDGNYRIEGIPAGQYLVFVHALPPDANIEGPWDVDGKVVAPSGAFNSLLYPGTTDMTQVWPQIIPAGKTIPGIDFAVTKRDKVPVYDGQIFGYLNNNTVANRPAPVVISGATVPVAASVTGLGSNGKSPGLDIQFADPGLSVVPNGILPTLSNGFTYVYLYLKTAPETIPGPQHLIFSTPDYMYILPSAMNLTTQPPPALTGLTPNKDGSLTVTGANFTAGMQIYFDSLPSTIISLDPSAGAATVIPPSGGSGQQANLIAYTPDGQNSQMWKSASPVTHTYGNSSLPEILSVSPAVLPGGSEGAVEIAATGTVFASGITTVGFGTADILVRGVTVLSPSRLRVNISVAQRAQAALANVTVLSGFSLATAAGAFQISPAVPSLPTTIPALTNVEADSGITGAFPGASVSVFGSNLIIDEKTPPIVTVGGKTARLISATQGQLSFEIPSSTAPGIASLQIDNGTLTSSPVDITVDPAPAGFSGFETAAGESITPFRPARIGDTIISTLTGFATAASPVDISRVQASLGGIALPVTKVRQLGLLTQITLTIPDTVQTGLSRRLIIYRDGLSSLPATIGVVRADGSLPVTQ